MMDMLAKLRSEFLMISLPEGVMGDGFLLALIVLAAALLWFRPARSCYRDHLKSGLAPVRRLRNPRE
jgi:hypothetical protein